MLASRPKQLLADRADWGFACSYDINLTPDKRQALLHNEAAIFQAFQEVGSWSLRLLGPLCTCTASSHRLQAAPRAATSALLQALGFHQASLLAGPSCKTARLAVQHCLPQETI